MIADDKATSGEKKMYFSRVVQDAVYRLRLESEKNNRASFSVRAASQSTEISLRCHLALACDLRSPFKMTVLRAYHFFFHATFAFRTPINFLPRRGVAMALSFAMGTFECIFQSILQRCNNNNDSKWAIEINQLCSGASEINMKGNYSTRPVFEIQPPSPNSSYGGKNRRCSMQTA